MNGIEVLEKHGFSDIGIKDMRKLQIAMLTEMSDIWEWTYKTFMHMKSDPNDMVTLKEFDREKRLIIDNATELYRVIYFIRDQYLRNLQKNNSLLEEEKERCAHDFNWFADTWLWVHEPRNTQLINSNNEALPPSLPFIMYPAQRRVIDGIEFCYQNRLDCMVGKSREAGISWGFMAWGIHKWLFSEGFRLGVGSEKADKVDMIGSSNPLMGKGRYLLYSIPSFFRPPSMKFEKNHYDNQFRIINPNLGSEILGEVGDNIGRSGRYSAFVIDEAQDLSSPQRADEGLESATSCRIDVGTARGMNHFGTKWKSNAVVNYQVMWYEDPRKTKKWELGEPDKDSWWRIFTEEKNKDNPAKVRQEYDFDLLASVPDICIPPEWVQAAINLQLDDDRSDNVLGYDIKGSGSDSGAVVQREGSTVTTIEEHLDKHVTNNMWKAYRTGCDLNVNALNYDKISVGETFHEMLLNAEVDIPFAVNAIVGNASAGEDILATTGKPANQVYYNLRARAWVQLRNRFKKTFEFVAHGTNYAHSELISIPFHPKLIEELSYPKLHTRNGKYLIESKEQMKLRGLQSPNFADAAAYAFFDVEESCTDKVFNRFNMSRESGNIRDLDVEVGGNWKYVVSTHIQENNLVSILVGRFRELSGQFHILADYESSQLKPEDIKQILSFYVNPDSDAYKDAVWIGNKELFKGIERGEARIVELLRKKGIRLRENWEEDDQLGMAISEDLLESKKLLINTSCRSLIIQMPGAVMKGRKVDSRYGLVKALLLMITYLKERKIEFVLPKKGRGYEKSLKAKDDILRRATYNIQ